MKRTFIFSLIFAAAFFSCKQESTHPINRVSSSEASSVIIPPPPSKFNV